MYPRHRLDLKARHLAYAGAACLWAHGERGPTRKIEQSSPEGALVCFSVRSSFELLLDALALPPRDEFGEWLRRRPSAPLLALLARRLATFDRERLRRRAERGEQAAAALPPAVFHPGRKARERTHWVFPVASALPSG